MEYPVDKEEAVDYKRINEFPFMYKWADLRSIVMRLLGEIARLNKWPERCKLCVHYEYNSDWDGHACGALEQYRALPIPMMCDIDAFTAINGEEKSDGDC